MDIVKKKMQLLAEITVIDPKRHYKKGDSRLNTFPNIFSGNVCEVGTVVEPVSEYFTFRLTKRERNATSSEELLSHQSLKIYR
ncbi:hypothetical protein LXL04_028459 [Taraxacum kok-saghyz]